MVVKNAKLIPNYLPLKSTRKRELKKKKKKNQANNC